MNILVVGAGRVGIANAIHLCHDHNVTVYDIDEYLIARLQAGDNPYEDIYNTSAFGIKYTSDQEIPEVVNSLIICIPFSAQFWAICIDLVKRHSPSHSTFIRTSVNKWDSIPGYLKDNRIFAYPEFLVEGEAGGVCGHRDIIASFGGDPDLELLAEVFGQSYVQDLGDPRKVWAAKIWNNILLANKTVMANVMRECMPEFSNEDFKEITDAVEMDPRIGTGYLRPGIGYGGSCLPYAVETYRDNNPFIGSIAEYNEDLICQIPTAPTLFFGYCFKAGVVDSRNSRQEVAIARTATRGTKVFVTDDHFHESMKEWWVSFPTEKELEQVQQIVIFYDTKNLALIERFMFKNPESQQTKSWYSKNIIDFRYQ